MNKVHSAAPLLFLVKTLVCQIAAAAFVIVTWQIVPHMSLVLFGACVLSYGMATLFSLSRPWRIINLFIPLAAAITLFFEMPSWIFLVVTLSLFVVYAPAFWTRVPYYPTPRAAYSLILAELPTDRPFIFLDIGCGFGDLLAFLSARRPNGSFVGIEIGILPWLAGWMRAKILRRKNLRIHFKNMWSEALGHYDYVYTFLSPAPMALLWQKAQAEMAPGTLFITNTFQVPAVADEELSIRDQRCSRLFLYRMKGTSAPRAA